MPKNKLQAISLSMRRSSSGFFKVFWESDSDPKIENQVLRIREIGPYRSIQPGLVYCKIKSNALEIYFAFHRNFILYPLM